MSGTHSKESFFGFLEQLDDSDDQDEEYNEWERLLYSTKYKAPDKVAPTPVADRISLHRAHSDPQPSSSTHQYKTGTLTDDSRAAPLIRHKTTGAMPTTKSGGPPQKKRRTNGAKIIPQGQQIFKDLVFCEYFIVFPQQLSLTY
jgi:DNA polymerase IV